MTDLTLRQLQTNLPWTIKYSQDFRLDPRPHKDFSHALTHIVKASGKLSEMVDSMDHDRDYAVSGLTKEVFGKYVADLVVCALRMAVTFPGSQLDLQMEVQHRIENKNGIELVIGERK